MTTSSFIEELDERSFSQRVLGSELPVLVVVSVNGSGADQGFLKVLEEWAPQARGRLRIFRLSAAASSAVAQRFDIPLAPGLALISRGAICYQFMGRASRGELDELLTRANTLRISRENTDASGVPRVKPPEIAD